MMIGILNEKVWKIGGRVRTLLFIPLIVLISCERREYFTSEFVNELTKTDSLLPSQYGGLMMFVKGEQNQIGVGNLGSLYALYKRQDSTQYSSFNDFVKHALNQRIAFKNHHLRGSSWIVIESDEHIKAIFDKDGIAGLIKENCDKVKDGLVIRNTSLSKNQLYTLLYLLFLNHYTITRDDYIGAYYAKYRERL